MPTALELAKELILEIIVVRNQAREVNVLFHNLNEPALAGFKPTTPLALVKLQSPHPRLQHRTEHPKIVPTIADLLHVTAHNEPRTEPHLLCELTEGLIIYDTCLELCHKALAFARVTVKDLESHNITQNGIANKLQLFIVHFLEIHTVGWARRHNHRLLTRGCLLGPKFRAADLGLVHTRLLENLRVRESSLPAILTQNLVHHVSGNFLIGRIPRIKNLGICLCGVAERFQR